MTDRRKFLQTTAATAAALALTPLDSCIRSTLRSRPIFTEIQKTHDEALKRSKLGFTSPPSPQKNRGMNEGCELTMQMLREAGFSQVTKVPTEGQPGIFATLDSGAPKTLASISCTTSSKSTRRVVVSALGRRARRQPGLGKVVIGRGAVNQKGPEATFLAALHAIRGAGRKLPVNLVFVAEGEEEIGSPISIK